ncbi:MAG: right-handed parallel beta-helix repeat-containing protein [Planctomycetaceae bacterium]
MKQPQLVLCALTMLIAVSESSARTIYVNNLAGSNRLNGLAEARESGSVGPVRSLQKAVRLANFGDTIVIANTGVPYYESLHLTGGRHSGNATVPFRVLGNGATLSGRWSVPPECWKGEGQNLWSIEPPHKGHYLLFRDGQKVEQADIYGDRYAINGMEVGKFAVNAGRVFYRTDKGEDPRLMNFAMPQRTTGISLYGVRNVLIQDLNVKHFRIDGVNAHDLCRNVLLRKVSSEQNARSGMTVAGSSRVILRNCNVKENGATSLRIQERGEADVQDCNLDTEPALIRE